jgi:transcriptional regulator with XRE-family HTH domain
MDVEERGNLIREIHAALGDGTLTLGQTISRLRLEITGLSQAKFAKMCKISERSLLQLEQDAGNPTVKSLNKVMRPFGLTVGIVALNRG